MRLRRIELKNICHFQQLSLELASANSTTPITVILGEQNVGKTAILKNTFHALSWFSARHKDLRNAGIVVADGDILSQATRASVMIEVEYPQELGNIQEDSNATATESELTCTWSIQKTLSTQTGLGISRTDTVDLEKLVTRYQKQLQQDPQFSTPCIAYYPAERFINDINIHNKNAASSLEPMHNAYDVIAINFTMFSRFFDWFREIHDLESAQTSQLLQQYLNPEQRFQTQEQLDEVFANLESAYRLAPQRCLNTLRTTMQLILPGIQDMRIEFQPRAQLIVQFKGQDVPFTQLPQTYKTWFALVGDLVRRVCLLNPNTPYPCLEAEGVILIDAIDALLDRQHRQNILARLQQAFPRLQFIVSAIHDDVIDAIPDAECFKLIDKQLIPLNLMAHQQNLDLLYQSLHGEPQLSEAENLATETSASDIEDATSLHTIDDILRATEQLGENERTQLLAQIKRLNES